MKHIKHKVILIGAGPAGLQTAYYLKKKNIDYLILEAGSYSGTFFSKFPIHRKMISINKRFTGSADPEFNMRHDWNSLLTDDYGHQFTNYDRALLPNAENMVRYLNDFKDKYSINVQYETVVTNIALNDSGGFVITTNNGDSFYCDNCIYCGGFSEAILPHGLQC